MEVYQKSSERCRCRSIIEDEGGQMKIHPALSYDGTEKEVDDRVLELVVL